MESDVFLSVVNLRTICSCIYYEIGATCINVDLTRRNPHIIFTIMSSFLNTNFDQCFFSLLECTTSKITILLPTSETGTDIKT